MGYDRVVSVSFMMGKGCGRRRWTRGMSFFTSQFLSINFLITSCLNTLLHRQTEIAGDQNASFNVTILMKVLSQGHEIKKERERKLMRARRP